MNGRLSRFVGPVVAERDHGRLARDLLVDRSAPADQLVADEAWQEVVDHRPLVVPPGKPARGLEHPLGPHPLGTGEIDEPVVKLRECDVQLRDDQVLIVAGFDDESATRQIARQVEDAVDVQLQPELGRIVRVIDRRIDGRPTPVDGVEVVARRAEVDACVGVGLLLRERRVVERDVVVDELADEREACEQPWAGVEVLVVGHPLVLDHLCGKPREQVVGRRERRQLLEHRPELPFGEAILGGQEHASERGAVKTLLRLGSPRRVGPACRRGADGQRDHAA